MMSQWGKIAAAALLLAWAPAAESAFEGRIAFVDLDRA
jgi:Skp family chaperone for outer membrane proteins